MFKALLIGIVLLILAVVGAWWHTRQRTEDGQLAITFNGEVYNFEALRRELVAAGHGASVVVVGAGMTRPLKESSNGPASCSGRGSLARRTSITP